MYFPVISRYTYLPVVYTTYLLRVRSKKQALSGDDLLALPPVPSFLPSSSLFCLQITCIFRQSDSDSKDAKDSIEYVFAALVLFFL